MLHACSVQTHRRLFFTVIAFHVSCVVVYACASLKNNGGEYILHIYIGYAVRYTESPTTSTIRLRSSSEQRADLVPARNSCVYDASAACDGA